MKKYIWKLWLRLNLLTKEIGNDYIAVVSTIGKTIRNKEIAELMVEEGSEIKEETIVSILEKSDHIIMRHLQQGGSVQTNYCHLSPRVMGTWLGGSFKYDPKTHKLTLDMTLTAAMRAKLEEVGLEVLGIKDSGAFIGLVTDGLTGLTDGTITVNEDIIIEGDKIKISPIDEGDIGIFFVDDNERTFKVEHRLLQNDPKKIIARVPELEHGNYKLHIITRYTSGNKLLNDPRVITYETMLVVQ
jgi:hypothetical protein